MEELAQFMEDHWNTELYCDFSIGRPTVASREKYILLSATGRFMVIVLPRKAGGIFSKDNKVVLSVCDTPEGAKQDFARSIKSHNDFFRLWQIDTTLSVSNPTVKTGGLKKSLLTTLSSIGTTLSKNT